MWTVQRHALRRLIPKYRRYLRPIVLARRVWLNRKERWSAGREDELTRGLGRSRCPKNSIIIAAAFCAMRPWLLLSLNSPQSTPRTHNPARQALRVCRRLGPERTNQKGDTKCHILRSEKKIPATSSFTTKTMARGNPLS